jgi:hypothetical protein
LEYSLIGSDMLSMILDKISLLFQWCFVSSIHRAREIGSSFFLTVCPLEVVFHACGRMFQYLNELNDLNEIKTDSIGINRSVPIPILLLTVPLFLFFRLSSLAPSSSSSWSSSQPYPLHLCNNFSSFQPFSQIFPFYPLSFSSLSFFKYYESF